MVSGFAGVLNGMLDVQGVTGSSPVSSTKPKSFTPLAVCRVSAIFTSETACAGYGQMLSCVTQYPLILGL